MITAIIFFVLAGIWSTFLTDMIIDGAKESAALTAANEKSWKDIPGAYDLVITNSHYFFHCTNSDDVVYKGLRPIFEEYGPYIYREYDIFTNITYGVDEPVTGTSDTEYFNRVHQKESAPGLKAIYN